MGMRSVTLGTEWQLLGVTPLEVDTHSTYEIAITVADEMPTDANCDCFRMRYDYNSNRTFDTPGMNVYARALSDLGAVVQVVPRLSLATMLAAIPSGLLTLDPETGDVSQQEKPTDGTG